jgi:hypothetical protein
MFAVRESEAKLEVDRAFVRSYARNRVRNDRVVGSAVAERDFVCLHVKRDGGGVEDNVVSVRHPDQGAVMRVANGPGSGNLGREKVWRISCHQRFDRREINSSRLVKLSDPSISAARVLARSFALLRLGAMPARKCIRR